MTEEDAAPLERSSERQKLAEAIAYLAGLDRQLERLAEARARLGLRDKQRAIEASRHALAEARQRAPYVLVQKAMGEAYDPTQTVEHAEGLLEDAQRDLAEATEADKLLADEIAAVEQRRTIARYGRDDRLAEVLRTSPEIAELRDRIERTRQMLHNFTWICSAIGQQRLPHGLWDGILWGKNTGQGDEWRAALARLEIDADAPLPTE